MGNTINNIVDKYGIFDYINVIVAGAIFFIGLSFLKINFLSIANISPLLKYKIGRYTVAICLCYFVGLILQISGGLLDSKLFHYRNICVRTCLWTNDQLKEKTSMYFFHKHEFLKIFSIKSIIDNHENELTYGELATELFTQKRKNFKKPKFFTEEQCNYFFDYCMYYNSVRGKINKIERMAQLRGLTWSMASGFILLFGIGLINTAITIYRGYYPSEFSVIYELAISILFLFTSILLILNNKNNTRTWVRMVLQTYEAAVDQEKVSQKS